MGEGGLRKEWQLSLKRKASVLPSYSAKVALFVVVLFLYYVFNLKISKYWKHAKILNVLNTFSEKKRGGGD